VPHEDAPLLDAWRQGDVALVPLELPALVLDGEEIIWQAIDAPHGVVILSQSCDIIKHVDHRPYVQVAGLVPANDGEIAKAARKETPSRIHLTCLDDKGLLIDLDAVATVHKAVVATWQHTPGCGSDEERRRVAAGIARHKQRFAFPDRFNEVVVRSVRRWIEDKRSKASPQGNFVRAMHEVRVLCDDWDAPTELTFLVIVNHFPDDNELAKWTEASKLLESKAVSDEYPKGEFRIVRYDDISAREYLESDRLDWEGLSDAP
jgi:hypothetical protein